MRFGLIVPHIGHTAGAASLRDVAQAAEALGFSSLWTADHVVRPAEISSPYPFNPEHELPLAADQPYLEIFPTLGFLAAVTQRIRLGTAVVVLPYRNPVLLAKLVTTVDALSEGRYIFGAGVGYLREEFEALGAPPFDERGAVTDEVLEFLESAWYGEQPVRGAYLHPGPYNGRRLPVWIGGVSRPARRRVARFGSGWIPHLYGAEPGWLASSLAEIRAEAAGLGRTTDITTALFVPMAFTATVAEDAPDAWKAWRLEGPPDHVAGVLRRYAACGVDEVILMYTGSASQRLTAMERIAAEVMPAVGQP
jgi:probable F420-dependent oxidoreductase